MAKELTFTELDSILSKIDDKGSIITKNTHSKIDEWIGTGNYILNAQISGSLFGGIPNSRSICLAGESGVGKTYLCLNICREAQKKGYSIIYCDSESAVDLDIVSKFGIDPNTFRYQPVNAIHDVRHFISNLCEKIKKAKEEGKTTPKIMIVLDSLGNLGTNKERTDSVSGNDKRDMTKQTELRSLFRVITSDLAELKIPFMFSNHTYASVGSYVPTQVLSGGGGAIYNASVILMMSKSSLKDESASESSSGKMGIKVKSKTFKNRFARPITTEFHISFYKGMNPYVGLQEYMNWETCGIQRGKLINESTFNKQYRNTDKEEEIGKTMFTILKDGKMETLFFEKKDTARTIVVKHLGEEIKNDPKELFTSRVITENVLRELDENIIKKTFELPNISDINESDLIDVEEEFFNEDNS